MFDTCIKLNYIYFNTEEEDDFIYSNNTMNFEEGNCSYFSTHKIKNMKYMFNNYSSLKYLDMSKINTFNEIDSSKMFSNCQSLEQLNLNSFKAPNLTNSRGMFESCINLNNFWK